MISWLFLLMTSAAGANSSTEQLRISNFDRRSQAQTPVVTISGAESAKTFRVWRSSKNGGVESKLRSSRYEVVTANLRRLIWEIQSDKQNTGLCEKKILISLAGESPAEVCSGTPYSRRLFRLVARL